MRLGRTVPRTAVVVIAIVSQTLVGVGDESIRETASQPCVPIASVTGDLQTATQQPVRLRGVVTWRQGDGMIIQDESSGIWVDLPNARRAGLLRISADTLATITVGMEVEIDGLSNRGGFRPNVLPIDIRSLGTSREPAARPVDAERFWSGADDCLRVCVRGVVQGFRDLGKNWLLLMQDGSRGFTVFVPKSVLDRDPNTIVDAALLLTGVATSHFNTRGEFQSPKLSVVHADDVVVEHPSSRMPARPLEVPLAAIAQHQAEATQGHRLRTQGTITHIVPGRFLYFQEGMIGVRIETPQAVDAAIGDRAEAIGFVARRGWAAGLVEAVVQRIEPGTPPPPNRIDPETILQINAAATAAGRLAAPGDWLGCLVTFPARIVDFQGTREVGLVLLLAGTTGLVATAEPEVFDSLRRFEIGSTVQLTGIVEREPSGTADARHDWRPMSLDRIRLLVRSPADVQLLRAPSWWKPERLVAALAALAVTVIVALGWIAMLRRQVRRQLRVIEGRLREEAVAEERRRIAREFHDTLEQGLAALSLRLDVAACGATDDRSRSAFRQQRQLLASLQTETRDFLWDLRDPVHVEGTLVESIATQLRHLEQLTTVPLLLNASGDIPELPLLVQYHVVRIVREAVNNAIKYAKPTGILVQCGRHQAEGSAESVWMCVSDDGAGFDVATRSVAENHFGIRGMHERARQIGAELTVESVLGHGTTVMITIPIASARPAGLGSGRLTSGTA